MSRTFAKKRPTVGAPLPPNTFGRLVGRFKSASHIPLRGGHDTGRHIYLSIKIPHGNQAGIFECAVNIRSDEGTEVLYTQRIEDLDTGGIPAEGFAPGVHLAYGTGGAHSSTDFMGLHDEDFHPIINDELYNRIADLCHGCDRVAAYGMTYSDGTGIHDIHMNSGTNKDDPHARDDRVHQDGAIAFYFDLEAGGQRKSYATWVFVKFANQHVVES